MTSKQSDSNLARVSRCLCCRLVIIGLVLGLFSGPASAENPLRIISAKSQQSASPAASNRQTKTLDEQLSELIDAANAAKGQFKPIDPQRLQIAKRDLQMAMSRVELLLSQNSSEVEASWKSYLDWNALQTEVNSATPSAALFNTAVRKLSVNQPGIENPAFLNLRSAMLEFKNASVYANLANFEVFYGQTLDRLVALLQNETQAPSLQNANDIGRIAGILDDADQADDLLKLIRTTYSQSNMIVTITERAICEISASQSVRNSSPVREDILGMLQVGNAETHGNLLVDLIPSKNMAEMIVSLEGVTDSDVMGTRDVPVFGQIEIYTKGKTRVHAETHLYIKGDGFSHGFADANVVNRSKLVGVCSPTLIRQVVKREVHKQSDKGNYIASERATMRVKENMNQQIMEALGQANARYHEKLLTPLARLDSTPERIAFSTTDETLTFEMLQAGNYQVGASLAAPTIDNPGNVVFQVHESLVANFMEDVLARKSITSEQVAKLNTGKKKLDTAQQKPWRITFFSVQPVQVSFRDNTLGIAILIREIEEAGESAVNRPLLVSATFKLEKTAQGLALLRQGPVDLTYRGDAPASVRESAVKGNLTEPMQELFPEKIDIVDIVFPEATRLRGKASFTHFEFAEGWMSAVIDLKIE